MTARPMALNVRAAPHHEAPTATFGLATNGHTSDHGDGHGNGHSDGPDAVPEFLAPPPDLSGLDPKRFRECVHCGLCTSACPTYLETGDENDSPRGRIHLVRAIAEGQLPLSGAVQRHLDLCLDCRSCETACPSGVHYGEIIESFRAASEPHRPRPLMEQAIRDTVFTGMFPYRELVAPAMWAARLSQRLGVPQLLESAGLAEYLPYPLRKMMALLPAPGTWQTAPAIPSVTPPTGPRRARVGFFTGCSAAVMFPATNYNTVAVLAANGCEVLTPPTQVCCGAIHYHAGQVSPAADLARRNLEVFTALAGDGPPLDAIVTNCGGCGHMLRHLGDVLVDDPYYAPAARAFVSRVRDAAEVIANLPGGPVPPTAEIAATATYHDSCHLSHGMGVRSPPRLLLARIPGLRLVPLREPDICCGAAGTYNLTEPDMSTRLANRKMANIADTQAQLVVAGNVVCLMQMTESVRRAGYPAEVVHTFDLLARAYRVGSAARA